MNGIKWGRIDRPAVRPEYAVLVASGKSVNDIDKTILRAFKRHSHIVTVNGAGNHITFANSWFTLDPWGLNGPQLPPQTFTGRMYAAVSDDYGTPTARSTQHRVTPHPKITFLHRLQSHNYVNISSDTAYKVGFSEDPSCISTGNSGYGCLNLLYHMRPKNIYMLGIDGNMGYFYDPIKSNRPLTYIKTLFDSTIGQLQDADIKVHNVSPNSTIKCFPKMTADEFHEMVSGVVK